MILTIIISFIAGIVSTLLILWYLLRPAKVIKYKVNNHVGLQKYLKNWAPIVDYNSKIIVKTTSLNQNIILKKIQYYKKSDVLRIIIKRSEFGTNTFDSIVTVIRKTYLKFKNRYTQKRKELNVIYINIDIEDPLMPSTISNICNVIFSSIYQENTYQYMIFIDGVLNFNLVPFGYDLIPPNSAFKKGFEFGKFFAKVFSIFRVK